MKTNELPQTTGAFQAHSWMPKAPEDLTKTVGYLRRTLPFRCPSANLLQQYVRQELDPYEMSSVKFHLLTCACCTGARDAVLRQLHERPPEPRHTTTQPASEIVGPQPVTVIAANGAEEESVRVVECTARETGVDHWANIRIDLEAGDAPGVLSANTEPYFREELFVNDLLFSVLDDNRHCRLTFDADGPSEKINRFKGFYNRDGELCRPKWTEAESRILVERPYVFAFAVQFDDAAGLAAKAAAIAKQVRPLSCAWRTDLAIVPSGSILSLVGHKAEMEGRDSHFAQFFMQGLIAAPEKEVEEGIVRDLLGFFREEHAAKWFLGNFGRPVLPTLFFGSKPSTRN